MSRRPSISDLANSVLDSVEMDELVKSANVSYTSNTQMQSDLGQQLVKVAELLRTENERSISYSDLERFRKTYGV